LLLQGPGACVGCVNAKDGVNCVVECPPCKYRDEQGVCQWCHPNCRRDSDCNEPRQCTGPGTHRGFGGCRECAGLLLDHQKGVNSIECLNRTDCGKGFYAYFAYRTVVSHTCIYCCLPALYGSRPLVTPYYCRLGDLRCCSCLLIVCLICLCTICSFNTLILSVGSFDL